MQDRATRGKLLELQPLWKQRNDALRGLPVERWSMREAATAYFGIGSHFGNARSQNAKGHVLGHVRDLGLNAAKMALGYGADVSLLDINLDRLRHADDIFGGRLHTVASNSYNIEHAVREADLVIGGVLIPGAAAPKIVTKAMVAKMKKGAVIVDVAIDQGGCIETAHPTTHSNPSYLVDGVVHYCVTNMPAAVPNTSTLALTNATFPYVLKLARLGANAAISEDKGIAEGVNTFNGILTYGAVAAAQKREWQAVAKLV